MHIYRPGSSGFGGKSLTENMMKMFHQNVLNTSFEPLTDAKTINLRKPQANNDICLSFKSQSLELQIIAN